MVIWNIVQSVMANVPISITAANGSQFQSANGYASSRFLKFHCNSKHQVFYTENRFRFPPLLIPQLPKNLILESFRRREWITFLSLIEFGPFWLQQTYLGLFVPLILTKCSILLVESIPLLWWAILRKSCHSLL